MMNTARVRVVSENSDFSELTWFLFSSYQEKERKVVEDILIKRENGLKDEIEKVGYELEKEKKKVEEFKQHCGVLENEVEKMREDCEKEVEKMKERCSILEKEEVLMKMMVEDEAKKSREDYEKEVEMMKEQCGIVEKEGVLKQKVLEDEMEKMRGKYEEELKKERGFVVEEKKKVEKLTKSRMEFEMKMNEHCGVLVKDGYLKKKMLEDEVKKLEKELEMMKERCGVVEKEGRLKEKVLEDEVKRLKASYEKESELMKKKLTSDFLEKMEFEEKVNERCAILEKGCLEKNMMEEEVKRLKESYEKELEKERGFVAMEKKKVERLEEHCEVVENEGYLKQKVLEDEVKKLRHDYEKESEKVAKEKRKVKRLENHRDVVEREVKRLRENYDEVCDFVDDEKKKVEKLEEHCGVVEREGYLKKKMWEDEAKILREKYENECDLLRRELSSSFLEQLELEKKIKRHCDVEEKWNSEKKLLEDEVKILKENYEKESDLIKMNERCDVLEKDWRLKEKMWEDEVKRLKESYEKERAFVDMEKKKVEKLEEHCEDVENEGKLREKIWEEEVKRLRDNYEQELEKERGLMKHELSLASTEKMELEDKMARESEMFEMEREAMQKSLKAELRKLRECHEKELKKENDFMEKKLSWVILEKLTLEEELRKRRLENSREKYEEELKRERDISKNKLVLAASEKMNLEEELNMQRMEFEDRIAVLERKTSDVNKELELYKERFCDIGDFVEQIGVYDSTVNGNVRASGGLSVCKSREREKRGCSVLEDEFEDGGYNDNNLRCKMRRIMDGSKDTPAVEENTERALVCHKGPLLNDISRELDAVDGIGRCSAHSRVDSSVESSENKEVAGFQTSKEPTWSRSDDMVSAFRDNPELCLAAVCTLYRQHISAGVFSGDDIHSATDMAKYLIKNDAENKLSRSVLEVQRDWPHGPYVLQTCEILAIRYKEQLFEIYQKNSDPFFCVKS